MKKIVICVSAGIACYKALDVCSYLKKMGYYITVVMSENATKFISPLLFKTITNNKVFVNLFEDDENGVSHINLVKENDLIVVVPATANIIAKTSNGIADNFISTLLCASNPSKTVFFPTMNTRMYENSITQENIEKLKNLGYKFVEPDTGLLACGDVGKGKLPKVEDIVKYIDFFYNYNPILKDKNILITAGGTREYIDPVRYISNLSSGKMGYALANQATRLGAKVTLITTETNIETPIKLHKIIKCISADDMYKCVFSNLKDIDIIIKTAAVSDFKIKNYNNNKIKKKDLKELKLDLELNKDILLELSKIENRNFKLVGFAAESENLKENALIKLKNKNLDYIIANDISDKNIGFNSDNNKVTIYGNDIEIDLDIDTKENIAKKILLNLFK